MELGQLVDYVIEYNELHDLGSADPGKTGKAEKNTPPKKRKATQADWDAFWG